MFRELVFAAVGVAALGITIATGTGAMADSGRGSSGPVQATAVSSVLTSASYATGLSLSASPRTVAVGGVIRVSGEGCSSKLPVILYLRTPEGVTAIGRVAVDVRGTFSDSVMATVAGTDVLIADCTPTSGELVDVASNAVTVTEPDHSQSATG